MGGKEREKNARARVHSHPSCITNDIQLRDTCFSDFSAGGASLRFASTNRSHATFPASFFRCTLYRCSVARVAIAMNFSLPPMRPAISSRRALRFDL